MAIGGWSVFIRDSGLRKAAAAIVISSAAINVLNLNGSLFMLEVYDRILPSKSMPSLVAICCLCAMLFAAQCAFDIIRGRIFIRIASLLDHRWRLGVFDASISPEATAAGTDRLSKVKDFDAVKFFLASPAPLALIDLPWLPLYLLLSFTFHPLIGLTILGGAILLVCLTLLTHFATRQTSKELTVFGAERIAHAQASARNSEVLLAMGMANNMGQIWSNKSELFSSSNRRLTDQNIKYSSISKTTRLGLQSVIMAVGAYVVIKGDASAGVIVASSVLSARALAPLDAAIASWRLINSSWMSLGRLLAEVPVAHDKTKLSLPRPTMHLSVSNLAGRAHGQATDIVRDISFSLEAGSGVAVIGPSASGKSALVRLLIGAWEKSRGTVRLDGAELDQWDRQSLGAHIGYLPQSVELFSGTVAENIARFAADASPQEVLKAASAANVHELILRLPNGYNTEIGDNGCNLSGGQRQRIALARALFRDPFLVILDEPNSNLDGEGEDALANAIQSVRDRAGIVIVVAHRPSVLGNVNLVAVMQQGRLTAFDRKEVIFAPPAQRDSRAASSDRHMLKVVSDEHGDAS
ncbi:ATP-binding cassette, subfamily C, PrsD [Rhizobium sp. NFR07]|uniref:type I secretion system permease/ATPase n=1 Tax=Rhizobium sp. NFR07 TaxID=1566262 RepID=UPI0008E98C32|nr:type I secretion system permease/ATPase [Rhizobium sp. NFR07]SFB51053.1 ATP-binding cassette, subfamily C, PrsD [Rhizobium sp. NFR07]